MPPVDWLDIFDNGTLFEWSWFVVAIIGLVYMVRVVHRRLDTARLLTGFRGAVAEAYWAMHRVRQAAMRCVVIGLMVFAAFVTLLAPPGDEPPDEWSPYEVNLVGIARSVPPVVFIVIPLLLIVENIGDDLAEGVLGTLVRRRPERTYTPPSGAGAGDEPPDD